MSQDRIPIYIFFAIILIIFSLLINNNILYEKEENKFIEKEVSGVLTSLSNLKKGDYFLAFSKGEKKDSITLTISWFLKENNIVVGDSVYKKANDRNIIFFKKSGNQFFKCCTYEIN